MNLLCLSALLITISVCYGTEGLTDATASCTAEACPDGYTNDGLFCKKPAPYGVGAGYAWQFGDGLDDTKQFERCKAENAAVGCEKVGLIIYPKCRDGYKKAAGGIAFMCDKLCPPNYTDIGISCKKPCATA